MSFFSLLHGRSWQVVSSFLIVNLLICKFYEMKEHSCCSACLLHIQGKEDYSDYLLLHSPGATKKGKKLNGSEHFLFDIL